VHRGNAPQVRAKAQERLISAAVPAVAALRKALRAGGPQLSSAVAAARDILDRVLGQPGWSLEVTGADGGDVGVLSRD